jgi:succinylarginine dihydrolase
MLHARHARRGHLAPLAVRANPQLGVHLIAGDELAAQDVPHEEVVVHHLRDDLRNGGGVELEEGIVL